MSSTPPKPTSAPRSPNKSPALRPKPLTPARPTPPGGSGTVSAGAGGAAPGTGAGPKGAGNALAPDDHTPVDPQTLADAMANLDTLRKVKTPSASAAPSAATSPVGSGASSPNPTGIPTHGLSQTVMMQSASQPAGQGVPVSLQMQQGPGGVQEVKVSRPSSAPGTPHFGAQSEM